MFIIYTAKHSCLHLSSSKATYSRDNRTFSQKIKSAELIQEWAWNTAISTNYSRIDEEAVMRICFHHSKGAKSDWCFCFVCFAHIVYSHLALLCSAYMCQFMFTASEYFSWNIYPTFSTKSTDNTQFCPWLKYQ